MKGKKKIFSLIYRAETIKTRKMEITSLNKKVREFFTKVVDSDSLDMKTNPQKRKFLEDLLLSQNVI